MGGYIEHPVRGQNSIDAWRTQPIVPHMIVALQVQVFDAALREE